MNEAEKVRKAIEADPDAYVFCAVDGDRASSMVSMPGHRPDQFIDAMASLVVAASNHENMTVEEIIFNITLGVQKVQENPGIHQEGRE